VTIGCQEARALTGRGRALNVVIVKRVVSLTIAFAAGLAACGGSSPSSANAPTSLTITTKTGAANSVLVPGDATLECGGADGPTATGFLAQNATAACAAVASGALQKVAQSQRSGRLCSQIYGGPQTAHIKGTVDGKKIDLSVSRTDGCGISDWTALTALLGDPDRTGDVEKGKPASSTTSTTAGPTVYTVQRGDTLTSIAKRFGVRVSDLLTANTFTDPDNLVEGQSVTIPKITPPELTVTRDATTSNQLDLAMSGALSGELVTFTITSPAGSFTGPAHKVAADGTVTASYDTSGTTGTFAITANGSQGSTATATFALTAG
jgi:LysM repeat protein